MLNLFGTYPRFINIEDEFNELFPNIWDPITPLVPSSNILCDSRIRPISLGKSKKYIISIAVGKHYEFKDIKMNIEGRKLKVSGSAVECFKNGKNILQFEREYDIPENVDISTMTSNMSNGTLNIIFDKITKEPNKEIEYLSNEQEFKVRMNLTGFKPEEMNIKLVGSDLTIEGARNSQTTSEDGYSHSISGYVSRTIRLPPEVDLEKLRAVKSESGIEISAPKDPKKTIQSERTLQIEN